MIPIGDSPITRNGNLLLLAMDHGLEHGPVDFEPVPETIDPNTVFEIACHEAVTAIALQKGIAETYYPSYADDVNLLVKLNGTSNLWMGEPDSAVTCSVEYAVELGADAVGFTIYPGSNHEIAMVEEFRDIQEAARDFEIPVVLWSYPRGQGIKNDTSDEVISYAARIALELGADVVKVKYPGSTDAMNHAVDAAGKTKVVMSGGSKIDSDEFLQLVANVIEVGGSGLAVGRNVWQRDDPAAFLDSLNSVLYEETPAEHLVSV